MHAVKSGEFILSGIDARHGAFGIVPAELEGAVVTNDFWCLEFDENVIDKHLFLKLTSTSFFDDLCKKASDGTTNRVRLQAEKFYNLEIDLPSVEEQKILIESFQKFEIHNNQITTELSHQLELVSRLRQAFLREAMQGKLVPQDRQDEPAVVLLEKIKAEKEKLIAEKKIKKQKPLPAIKPEEIPFEIPNNWTWCRLDEICDFVNGKAHEQYVSDKGNYILVNSRFVSTAGDTFLKYATHQLTPLVKNDVAIVMSDVPNGRALARCYLVEKDDTYTLNQRIGGIVTSQNLNSSFLNFALDRNQHFLNFDDGKKQTNLRRDQILSCPIPLPPLAEQKRIVEKLEKLMKFCDELEANIRQSSAQAETLLQVALKEASEPE